MKLNRSNSHNSRSPYSPSSGRPVERSAFISILRTGLDVGETRFVRRSALVWLASYPGDLLISMLHAKALVNEGRTAQALPILEAVWNTDPEFLEAQDLLNHVRRASGRESKGGGPASVFALGGRPSSHEALPEWSRLLRQARQAMARKDFTRAEECVLKALQAEPENILIAITHLNVDSQQSLPLEAIRNVAELYHQRWPNCLQFTLLLAHSLMDGGESDRAVTLLHQAVAHDIAGQVPERLWGPDHPYCSLWPKDLEVKMEVAIPAGVASVLGWNQLTAGEPEEGQLQVAPIGDKRQPAKIQVYPSQASRDNDEQNEHPVATTAGYSKQSSIMHASKRPLQSKEFTLPEMLRSVQDELERVAENIKKPQLVRADGRFPIYVVFTTRRGLEGQYGEQGASQIDESLRRLVKSVRNRKDWGAMLYYADEETTVHGPTSFGLNPVKHTDPWELKLALVDLDASLSKRGEMIGAVLIVGGPEVVPFHHLPNPVDDSDADVPSDNPYATRDENYFIPEWPIGRLPGGAGIDPQSLLHSLQKLAERHNTKKQTSPWYRRWWRIFLGALWPWQRSDRPSLGYTAAIWKKASLSVYRPIGEPRSLLISPPMQVEESVNGTNGRNGKRNKFSLPLARLGYFNLHGLEDAVEWYGQSDPSEQESGPDYPVALRPEDVVNGGNAPEVVFSEACYGANILGKTVDEAMALKFLASGAQAVAGSTCISYGSIATPLISADLLGYAFWNYLGEGIPAGEALRRAKIHLAREMHHRQGFLDGEDQKTLISFVLYGDPLAQPLESKRRQKSSSRSLKMPAEVKTVCDRNEEHAPPIPIQPEVLVQVKHLVSQYLPGMADAQLSMCQEHSGCDGSHHLCPTAQIGAKNLPENETHRRVVVLSKQVQKSAFIHRHYARLTLDAQGKLVKLVVSR